jgi:hypothetical protein
VIKRPHKRWLLIGPAVCLLVPAIWAAFAPIESSSREEIFEIPKGTWARRMAGDQVEILPDTIRLTLGLNDVLLLKNHDEVPQMFGPTLMMPGQSFRLPFVKAATYDFACTAHASGQMRIIVDPFPDTPWTRLAWRVRSVFQADKNQAGNDADSRVALTSDQNQMSSSHQ